MPRSLVLPVLLASALPAGAAEVTFTKHVAPILWKHCAGCHRPGEIGPFSLLDYADAAKRAGFLADVTASRRMPPWKAEPGYGSFHDERRLGEEDIATLAAWAKAGAPEGDAKDLPPRPKFYDGWQLGTPDVVLKMPQPFQVPAGGRDILRCFVIPIPIDDNQMVSAVEFRPGNRSVVHHALLYLDNRGQARALDGKDGKPGYSTFGGPGILPTGGLGGWAPGAMPRHLPDGVGKYLRKGSDLVLQIHYHPDGKEEVDQSQVGIYFAKQPTKQIVAGIAMRSRNLYIPAGEKRHRVTAESAPLPVDASAIAIAPHMHYIGREMKVTAALPDGKQVPMIWIKDWDFNWQGSYQYEKPVRLPKGTVLKLEAYYDNSADNPFNPNDPPKAVRWGEQTTDEMCLCGVQVVTDNLADLRQIATMRGNLLGAALSGGVTPDDLGSLQKGEMPAGGVPIPERFQAILGRYDSNKDGKLTPAEIDAMPALLRNRVKQTIAERLGGGKP